MAYELYFDINGKVAGVKSELGFHRKGEDSPHWVEFVRQNPGADLSDKPPVVSPEELQRQADRQAVKDYLAKRKAGTATASDRAAALESLLSLMGS